MHYKYRLIYTIRYKDGSRKSGEIIFENKQSNLADISMEELLPYLKEIEQKNPQSIEVEGIAYELVPA